MLSVRNYGSEKSKNKVSRKREEIFSRKNNKNLPYVDSNRKIEKKEKHILLSNVEI